MRFKKLTAIFLAAFMTVGAIPMQSVMAYESDGPDEAALFLSEEAADEASESESLEPEDQQNDADITQEETDPGKEDKEPADEKDSDDESLDEETDTDEGADAASEETSEDVEEIPEEEAGLAQAGTGLTLNGNGGLVNTNKQDSSYHDIYASTFELTSPTQYLSYYEPKRDGFWFYGWYDGSDTSTANLLSMYDPEDEDKTWSYYRNTLKTVPNMGVTIYAGWETPAILDFNGGKLYDEDSEQYLDSYTLKERTSYLSDYVPSREDWYFTGWYSDSECKNCISSTSNVNNLAKDPAGNTRIYAGWTQSTVTVTFDFGENATYKGDLSDDKTVSRVEVSAPYGVVMDYDLFPSQYSIKCDDLHYSFSHWVKIGADEQEETVYSGSFAPTQDITLYARFVSNKKVFTKNANGGYFSREYDYNKKEYVTTTVKQEQESSSYKQVSISSYEVPKNDDPKKAFVDWCIDEECTTPVEKYKDYKCDTEWDGTGSYYYIKTDSDVTLYAKWGDTNKVLTLNPNATDGYFKDYQTYREEAAQKQYGTATGTKLSKDVTNPKRRDKHYKFTGWYAEPNCNTLKVRGGESSTDIEVTLTEDTTWYAGWSNTYKVVTFDAGAGYFNYYDEEAETEVEHVSSAEFRVGSNGTLERTPYWNVGIDNPNKTFDGWYLDGKKIENLSEYKFTKDVTVVARYTECYAVTFNYNGGYYEKWVDGDYVNTTEPLVLRVPRGMTINQAPGYVETPHYENDAKTFGGWYLSTDTEHINRIEYYNYIPESDIEFVAFWANNYTVTFDAGEGRFENGKSKKEYKAVENSFYIYNDGAEIPEEPEIDVDSKVFAGWTLLGEDVSRDDIQNKKITSNLTYVAKYTVAYSVSFDANGGTFVSKTPNYNGRYKIKVAYGQPIRGKVPTVRSSDSEHKVFSGWYTDAQCEGSPIDPYTYTSEGSTVLYAGWTECYKLTFHTNFEGATFANESDTQVVKVVKGTAFRYGEDYGTKTDKKDEIFVSPKIADTNGGYVIPGWYTNSALTGDRYVFEKSDHYVENSKGERTYYNNMYGFIPTSDMDFYARLVTGTVVVIFDANGALFDEHYTKYRDDRDFPCELTADKKQWKVTVPKGIKFGDIGEPYGFDYESRKGMGYDWAYKEKGCKNKVSGDLVMTTGMTVYCKWYKYGSGGGGSEGKSAEITFHAGDGYFGDDKDNKTDRYSYTYGVTTWQSAPTPHIDNDTKAFSGWFYDAALTKPYPAEYQMVRYNWDEYGYQLCYPEKVDDLYAGYGLAYTVVLDANGGYFDADYDRTKDPDVDMRETTLLRTKAYPGQAIFISDYTKRVRRDGNKLFGGWYTDKECSDENKIKTFALDNRNEHYRPTESCTLYAEWVDYEKPDEITASGDTGDTVSIDIGESKNLNAVVSPPLTGTDIHWFIDWYSIGKNNTEGEYPVKLDISGKVTGRAEGECTVYAEVNGVRSNQLTIKVSNKVVPSTISITDGDGQAFADPVELFTSEGFSILGTILPAESADDLATAVKWKSSDTSVAEVTPSGDGRNANVIAINEGTATITASLGDNTVSVNVKVTCPVELTPEEMLMTATEGNTRSLTAKALSSVADSDIEIKAYTSSTCDEYSTLVTLTQGDISSADTKKTVPVTIDTTAEGRQIAEPVTVTIRARVKVGDKFFTDVSTLTLNPQPQAGAVRVNIGRAYVDEDNKNITNVSKGTKVLLTCDTQDTDIFYTLDGSDPATDGTLYNDAIVISADTTLKAVAKRTGRRNSAVYRFDYAVSDWGDAVNYKDDAAFGGDISKVPAGIWYVIGDKVYTDAKVGNTDHSEVYTAGKITFNSKVKVFVGTTILVENRDYTLSFANNVNVADVNAVKGKKRIAPSLTVKGKGNYTKTAVFKFNIIPYDMDENSGNRVKIASESVVPVAAGPKAKLGATKPVVTFNGKKLALNKDYELKYYEGDAVDQDKLVANPATALLTEAGKTYTIAVSGKGNFTELLDETVTVKTSDGKNKSLVKVSKLKVGDIKNKAIAVGYTGEAYTAAKLFDNSGDTSPLGYVYVKSASKDALIYGTDYEVTLTDADNTSAGKHGFIITGKGDKFVGTKTGTYTISEVKGKNWKSVKVAGLSTTTEYIGREIELFDLFNANDKVIKAQKWDKVTLYRTETVKAGKKKVTNYIPLVEGVDYAVEMENAGMVGKFTLVFKGINGYSGSTKKTIKVNAYNMADSKKKAPRIEITCSDAVYSKRGAVPESIVVTYTRPATDTTPEEVVELKEGMDYSLSFKNNAKIVDNYVGLKAKARPTVIVKGKGNYKGSNATSYFNIEKADIEERVTLSAADVVRNPKGKNGYKLSVPKLMDGNKALTVGKNKDVDPISAGDYEYFYAEDTVLEDEAHTRRFAGERLYGSDAIPFGTLIRVTVKVHIVTNNKKIRTKESPYYASGAGDSAVLEGYYRFLDSGKDISKMSAGIKKGVVYSFHNGDEIIPVKTSDIQVSYKVKGQKTPVYLGENDFEIISVSQNRFLGTATVVIRGKGAYGGTKSFTFKITAMSVQG
ncbi:MAG: InlB B-repeat-containing protein [Butyrivibrio sp.]|nr:InlB B-repeat-containing protein [Butyrivibrio sp.]